ncbi:MAG: hypothetical protein GF401_05165 [Chitinivibrionales bacterium]|nr:hypothetical protein [Chitinivibrionales bacterium]
MLCMKTSKSNVPVGVIFILFIAGLVTARTWVVDQQHPLASDSNDGTIDSPYLTIAPAADTARPGDTVLVHEGIYRERVAPARGGEEGQPIVYMAAPGNTVILKGSAVWDTEWAVHDSSDMLYTAALGSSLFGDFNPFHTRLARVDDIPGRMEGDRLTLGQMFVDNVHYREAASLNELELEPGSWMHDSVSGMLTLNFLSSHSPTTSQIEITVRRQVFAPYKRGLGYIHVIGFTVEHAANQFPTGFYLNDGSGHNQMGVVGCRSGHHWLIEGNVIRWGKNIGLDFGEEGDSDEEPEPSPPRSSVGSHIIRNNLVCDNGACGMAGAYSARSQVINNVVLRNNYLNHTAPENGGIKVHGFTDGIIRGNLVKDNKAVGIWLDAGFTRARAVNNILINNTAYGILIEYGGGPCLAANNIEIFTRMGSGTSTTAGDGISGQDASRITLGHNLSYRNARFGLFSCAITGRRGGSCNDWQVHNNVALNNGGVDIRFINTPVGSNTVSGNVTTPGKYLQDEIGGMHNDTLMTIEDFDTVAMTIEIEVRDTLFSMTRENIGTIDTDFFGNPLPDNPLPGPFQNLVPGYNKVYLNIDSLFADVPEESSLRQHPERISTTQITQKKTAPLLITGVHTPLFPPDNATSLRLFNLRGQQVWQMHLSKDAHPQVISIPAGLTSMRLLLVRWSETQ